MKVWQLTKQKEYKLFTTDKNTAQAGPQAIYFEPTLPNKPYIKVKLVKANLSCLDFSNYAGGENIEYPIIPARSAVALVSESNKSGLEQGRKVFLSPYDSDGKNNIKIRSYHLDGYLGDFMYVPLDSVYTIPEGVSDDQVLFVEDIAMCINVISKLNVEKGEYIVLQGASFLNIIMAQIAIYYQAIPIIIDNNEERLEIAEDAGVYYTINSSENNVLSKIIELTSGKMADKIVCHIDIANNVDGQIDLIKKDGKIAIYGYDITRKNIRCDITPLLHKGLQVIGINNGNGDIRSAINMLANNIINTSDLIENTTPFLNLLELVKANLNKQPYFKQVITFE